MSRSGSGPKDVDRHRSRVCTEVAAPVLRKGHPSSLHLSGSRLVAEMPHELGDLADASSADWMTFG